MNEELEYNLALEAAEVLEAVRDSGVALPENWRWPLIDELRGIEPISQPQYREPTMEDAWNLSRLEFTTGSSLQDAILRALKQLNFVRKVQP